MYKLVEVVLQLGETPAKPETTVQVVVSTLVSVRPRDIFWEDVRTLCSRAIQQNQVFKFIMILCVPAT